MKLTKHIRYLVRIRDYETVQVEVGAEADHHDLGYSDQDWAGLLDTQRQQRINQLELLLISEVEKQAHYELSIVAGWSEISPNTAEDFLSEPTTNTLQRNSNAQTDSQPARRVRRGGGSSQPPPAA